MGGLKTFCIASSLVGMGGLIACAQAVPPLVKPVATPVAPVLAPSAKSMATSAAPARSLPEPAVDFAQCLTQLRTTAPQNGVSVADFDRYTRDSRLLTTTALTARNQPEQIETWWDYITKTVDDERVKEGQAMLKKLQPSLAKISARYHVDREPLIAIFGIETNFGTRLGKTDILNSWLTRACTEKKPLWIKNVYASISLLRDGVVSRDKFVGSWSGAFGMTQFIPTTFLELAVDGDGDGRIDLYGSFPDALASTANHLLKRSVQWVRGLPPIIEVHLPRALAMTIPPQPDAEFMNPDDKRSLKQWAAAGVVRATGAPLKSVLKRAGASAESASAYLFAPTGRKGPIFLVTANFDALLQYNRSHKYALAVSLLTNRLAQKHDRGLITPWPTDNLGLTRAQIKNLQTLLAQSGYDIGVADGILGNKTRQAVQAEKQRLGLPQDGEVGLLFYKAFLADRHQSSSHPLQKMHSTSSKVLQQ